MASSHPSETTPSPIAVAPSPPYFQPRSQTPAGVMKLVYWLKTKPEVLTLLLVLAIGSATGLAIVGFHGLVEFIHYLTLEVLMGAIGPWGDWTLAIVPILGGLAIGLMRWGWRDFGESNPTHQPPSLIQAAAKLVAASISLGTGASLGPEGPSVEAGASLGRSWSHWLRMSEDRRQLLLGAGAAAGLAAGFNAPIAAVFLAVELFLKTTFAASTVGFVLLAAVAGALITQVLLGWQPPFDLPVYDFRSFKELPLYVGLGGLASLVSQVLTQAIKLAERLFKGEVAWFQVPPLFRPILGGLSVGLAALLMPQVLGVGYETVEAILRNVSFDWQLLLLLLVVKLVMTALSLGSGLVGGIFAPAMFLGAALGAAYGQAVALVLPDAWLEIAAPPAYAMVGMAAVLASTVRAPLTAVMLLFELTRDYRIILPLMAAVGISVLLAERCQLKPLNLQQMGMPLARNEIQEILSTIPVTQAMETDPLFLPASLTLFEGLKLLSSQATHSGLVINPLGELVGVITLSDLNRALAKYHSPSEPVTLHQICSKALIYVYSHESLAVAIARLAGGGLHQLPVIDQCPPHAVLGLVRLEQITLTYELALSDRLQNQYLTKEPQDSQSAQQALPLPLAVPHQSLE
ncbi:MAG: chloride channel protein [Aphanocapsa sp. GSE-SYN-MK-11-07L]|nr:chloride channel protein [Aphanocapsa sp. GSE-SYN-MK-11-07L]